MIRKLRSSTLFALFLAFAAAACSDEKDPVGPDPITVEDVAGSYRAEGDVGVLIFTEDEEETDWLKEGGKIDLVLDEEGEMEGLLLLPGAGEGGADLEVDLKGSWKLEDDAVVLTPDADTFLKELPLTFKGDKLEAKGTVGDAVIEVVLVRDDG